MLPVSAHYDRVAEHTLSRKKRRDLRTFPIREFNNRLKRAMLHEVRDVIPPSPRVLDVCCGRAGDAFKYNDITPQSVLFVDISTASINEAARRYHTGRQSGCINYEATFATADCFAGTELAAALTGRRFDLVVCHFALHYAFRSAETLTTFMGTLAAHMATGAHFLATYPNYHTLRRLLAHDDGVWRDRYSNSLMTVEVTYPFTDARSLGFGNEYLFSLEDAVTACPEYVVPPALLRAYLENHSLHTTLECGFTDAAQRYGLSLPNDADMQQVVALYTCHIAIMRDGILTTSTVEPNYRGVLQEECQARSLALPTYSESPSDSTWSEWTSTVRVTVGLVEMQETSQPKSAKKRAQQEAAALMLRRLAADDDKIAARRIPEDTDLLVHVDADHISFVSLSLTQLYPSVQFMFYCGYGSDVGHLRAFSPIAHPNVTVHRAPSPLKNFADSMILCAAAQAAVRNPTRAQVVVSRDATVYHAELLLPHTRCVTTLEQLTPALDSFYAAATTTMNTTPPTWSSAAFTAHKQ